MSKRLDSGTPEDTQGEAEERTELDHPAFTPEPGDQGSSTRVRTANEADAELRPGTMVGDYRLEGILGQGGMGTVYAAIHPLIGKRAAIKVLRHRHFDTPRALERFVQEARAVNEIAHHNIVDIFSFGGLPDGRAYLIMELLDGRTLASALAERSLRFRDTVEIFIQVCRALDAAHAKGIIHRDLKPDNIFLARRDDDRPHVKLLDFGIAKYTDAGDSGPIHSTETGMVMGTPGYVPPEQAKGKTVSAKTDIYSLGCIAYEAFTGCLPFSAETAVELVSMHLYVPAPDPRQTQPELPASLAGLMRLMLSKHPEERPEIADLRAVLEALRSFDKSITERMLPGPRYSAWSSTPAATPHTPPVPSPTQSETRFHQRTDPPSTPVATPNPPSRAGVGVIVVATVALVAAAVAVTLVLNSSGSTREEVTVAEPEVEIDVPAPEAAPEARPAVPEPATAAEQAPRRLVLQVAPRNATVRVDGEARTVLDGTVELELEREEAQVEVSAPGFETETRTVRVGEGVEEELTIGLNRTRTRQTQTRNRRHKKDTRDRDRNPDPDGTVNPFDM